MWKILFSLLFFTWAEMYLSQLNLDGSGPPPYFKHDLEPFSPDDFENPPQDSAMPCHLPHMKCLRELKNSSVRICALQKKYGLAVFDNICQVHMYNCMSKPKDTFHVYGHFYEEDEVYYNGKNNSCFYYVKMGKDIEDIFRIYYEEGFAKDEAESNIIHDL